MQTTQKHYTNKQIRNKQCRLIGTDGKLLQDNIPVRDALKQAQEQGLDLVELSVVNGMSVCKILDFGKYLYEQKKNKPVVQEEVLKEITVGVNTAEFDLQRFAKQISNFLAEGFKVQVKVKFTGRQMAHPELGREQLKLLISYVESTTNYAMQSPVMSGKSLVTILRS